jgi:hypothetical protein
MVRHDHDVCFYHVDGLRLKKFASAFMDTDQKSQHHNSHTTSTPSSQMTSHHLPLLLPVHKTALLLAFNSPHNTTLRQTRHL